MGGATRGVEQIEVVVLRGEEDHEDDRPAATPGPTGRRLLQALVALLVLAGVLLGPVVVDQPVELVERAAAPRDRPVDAGRCPDPAGRHLWCSFIDDPGCCRVAGVDIVPGVQPPGSRAA